MNLWIRIAMTFLSGGATFYFVLWTFLPLSFFSPLPPWTRVLMAAGLLAVVARFVWKQSSSPPTRLAPSVLLGAFAIGGLGFAAGFLGPLLIWPSEGANAGPLLGLFLTGPLGFVFGAAGGAVYWYARKNPVRATANWPTTGAHSQDR